MSEDNVIGMPLPGAVSDPVTERLRAGAKKRMAQAVEAEVAELLEQYAEARTRPPGGRAQRLAARAAGGDRDWAGGGAGAEGA